MRKDWKARREHWDSGNIRVGRQGGRDGAKYGGLRGMGRALRGWRNH